MPSLVAIRRRIKSAGNISQITKAMEMVSASKMRRAQDAATSSRPFTDKLEEILRNIAGSGSAIEHPLMEQRSKLNHVLLIIVSTDKGLCGGLNVNLFRAVTDWAAGLPPSVNLKVVTVGKRAKGTIPGRQTELLAKFQDLGENPSFEETRAIAGLVIDSYLTKTIDQVMIAYPKFITTLQNEPVIKQLLPFVTNLDSAPTGSSSYTFEPNPANLIQELVPYQIEMTLFQTLIESRASEHSARMVAMKAASDNARDLIGSLTLDYNQARQSAVTTELLDATTARMALS